MPNELAELLSKEGKEVPSPKSGWALIDTGASKTCVDDDLISGLGVAPVNKAITRTAGGSKEVKVYPVRFSFPGEKLTMDFNEVLGVDLNGQTAGGKPIVALIGRDVLSGVLLVYNGPAGMFTIAM